MFDLEINYRDGGSFRYIAKDTGISIFNGEVLKFILEDDSQLYVNVNSVNFIHISEM